MTKKSLMSFLFSYLRQRRPNIVDYEVLPFYVIGMIESESGVCSGSNALVERYLLA